VWKRCARFVNALGTEQSNGLIPQVVMMMMIMITTTTTIVIKDI
jgi:hypothetical protein